MYDILSDKYTYKNLNLNELDNFEAILLYEFLSWIDRNDLWDTAAGAVDILDFLENTLE